MSNWFECVNEQLSSSGIRNISNYVKQSSAATASPIDQFYQALQENLALGTPNALQLNHHLGPLIGVGIVSSTENYFRGVFSQLLMICPTSRSKASSQSINLGSVLWHGSNSLERAAFERTTFSDPEKIADVMKKFFDHPIDQSSPLRGQLNIYSEICELRHCIVHSRGYIQGKNAVALSISSSADDLEVNIGYREVQEIGEVCAGLVRAFNTNLFQLMCERWADSWRRSPFWNSAEENKIFNQLWDVFFSKYDDNKNTISPKFGRVKCRNEVKRQHGLM